MDDLMVGSRNPYSREIMAVPLPDKFKMPVLKHYDGTTDPTDHLEKYTSWMYLHGISEAIMCRAFDSTLEGNAKRWFRRLPEGSIFGWDQLQRMFLNNFIGARAHEVTTSMLLETRQRPDESLRKWIDRFTKVKNSMRECSDENALMAIQACVLRDSEFAFQMRLKPALTYTEYIARARHLANALLPSSPSVDKSRQEKKRKNDGESDQQSAKAPDGKKNRESRGPNRDGRPRDWGQPRGDGQGQNRGQNRVPGGAYQTYHALTATIEEIYIATQNRENYRPPRPLRGNPAKRNPNKYCRYHREQGHDTNDCWDLKDAVEDLMRDDRLQEYKANRDGPQGGNAPAAREIH